MHRRQLSTRPGYKSPSFKLKVKWLTYLGPLATPFWSGLAYTCVQLRSLWSRSNIPQSRGNFLHRFATQPNSTQVVWRLLLPKTESFLDRIQQLIANTQTRRRLSTTTCESVCVLKGKYIRHKISSFIRLCIEKGSFRQRQHYAGAISKANFISTISGKHFENGIFRKPWHHENSVISLPTQPQIHNDRLLLCFKLSPTYGDEKQLMRFQNENTISSVCTGL